jgi:anaerobic selenocysteine-containing dehydrogenase
MRDVFCSSGRNLSAVRQRTPYNPAHLNPGNLSALGIEPGDRVAIRSDYGRIEATAQIDETLRTGVVSLSHGWGSLPGEDAGEAACINLLTSSDRGVEAVNAMPRMSAIPVSIERLVEGEG